MGGVLPWTPGLPGEKISAMGKSIAQRSQRGMEVLKVVVLSVNALRFRARKKPTLSFTGVLPIGFLWAPTQIPPSVTSVRCFPRCACFSPRSHGVRVTTTDCVPCRGALTFRIRRPSATRDQPWNPHLPSNNRFGGRRPSRSARATWRDFANG
jgi:hypothetical protein